LIIAAIIATSAVLTAGQTATIIIGTFPSTTHTVVIIRPAIFVIRLPHKSNTSFHYHPRHTAIFTTTVTTPPSVSCPSSPAVLLDAAIIAIAITNTIASIVTPPTSLRLLTIPFATVTAHARTGSKDVGGGKGNKKSGKGGGGSSSASSLRGIFEGLHLGDGDVKEGGSGGVLLIGLGGGGLSIHLRHLFPSLRLDIVELDPEIVSVAKDWFMFEEDDLTTAHIGDGLDFVKKASAEVAKAAVAGAKTLLSKTWDVVIVDVDAKDSSSGMTCPPKSFIESGFLEEVSSILSPDGMMLMNVSARSQTNFNLAVENISQCFLPPRSGGQRGMVWHLQPAEDDVNRMVLASKRQHRVDEVVESGLEKARIWAKHATDLSEMVHRLAQATPVKLGQTNKVPSEQGGTTKKNTGKAKGKKKKGKK
jgi:spermidine synthase